MVPLGYQYPARAHGTPPRLPALGVENCASCNSSSGRLLLVCVAELFNVGSLRIHALSMQLHVVPHGVAWLIASGPRDGPSQKVKLFEISCDLTSSQMALFVNRPGVSK